MQPETTQLSAKQEWASMWPLPITAMVGVIVCSTFTYTNGVFLVAMTRGLGWSRTQFASAFTVQMLLGLLIVPLIGRLIDRIGPRRVALTGIVTFTMCFSLLGLANGSIWQWRLLCVLQALGVAGISLPTWLSATVSRFNASRGLALAITLAGVGVASAIWPLLAATYVGWLGWRVAFPALAFTGVIVLLPLTYCFFFGAQDCASPPSEPGLRQPPGYGTAAARPKLAQTIRSRTFIFILAGGGLYASVSLGFALHLIPILIGNGFSLSTAARVAGIAGLATIAGRLGTGFLLDRLPTRGLGLVIFLLPIVVAFLLWQSRGSLEVAIAAAILFGLVSGAETDILTYIASREIDPSIFASAYAVISSFLGACASLGPLLAGVLYDARGSYDWFLLAVVPISAASALLIWCIPAVARAEHTHGEIVFDGADQSV